MRLPLVLIASLAAASVGCSENKEGKSTAGETATPTTGTPTAGGQPPAQKKLPPPPADAMIGRARLLNLYLDAAGKTQAVDVWAARTGRYAAVKLAGNVELGKATPWFGVPRGAGAVIVPAGTDHTDHKNWIGNLPGMKAGDHVTTVWFASKTGPSTRGIWEIRSDGNKSSPLEGPPPAGKALITLISPALVLHRDQLEKSVGAKQFHLGTGRGKQCAIQRVENERQLGSLMGSPQPAFVDVAPGKTTFTLHAWPSKVSCDSDPLFQFDVEAKTGEQKLAFLYTPDGKTLDTVILPAATK